MTTSQRLMKWASEIHLAREHAEKLRKQMAALQCQHELAAETVQNVAGSLLNPDGCHYAFDDGECLPCWKGTYEDCGDSWGRKEFVPYGDHRDGGWCGPCEAREKLREPYAEAKRRLGSLKGALWRLAAKAHSEVEAELDAAGIPEPTP